MDQNKMNSFTNEEDVQCTDNFKYIGTTNDVLQLTKADLARADPARGSWDPLGPPSLPLPHSHDQIFCYMHVLAL